MISAEHSTIARAGARFEEPLHALDAAEHGLRRSRENRGIENYVNLANLQEGVINTIDALCNSTARY